jgi:hypothetical protein
VTTISGTSGDDVIEAPAAGHLTGVATNGYESYYGPVIDFSADGSKIVFEAIGTNIVPGSGSDFFPEVYVEDVASGAVTLVSSNSSGQQAGAGSYTPFFSADGHAVVFWSWASNLTAPISHPQAFLKNLDTGAVSVVSATAAGVQANAYVTVNGFAGGKIFFATPATNLDPGATNGTIHEYAKDVATGALTMLPGTGSATVSSVSRGGSAIAFITSDQALDPDHTFLNMAYVLNVATGVVTMASVDSTGVEANADTASVSLSGDGHLLAFASFASNLVAGDTNADPDIFVKNLTTGAVVRVSTDSAGVQADRGSFNPVFSSDGNLVAFASYADNLVSNSGSTTQLKLFVKNLATGDVTLIATATGSTGNLIDLWPVFSADGSQIAFMSQTALTSNAGGGGSLNFYTTSLGSVLDGGGGTDTVSFASASAGVAVSLALQGSAQRTGVAGVVTLTNFENLTGSAFADTLTGDGANNVIDGGGGADTLDGRAGVNTVSFASAGRGVTVSLGLQGAAQATGAGSVTLTNFQNLTGSAFADTLTGDSGDNLISGGGGADTLDGGAGVNTVSFASAGGGVTVSLGLQGAAQATGAGSVTLTNFQNLTGSAFADTLTGDSGDNLIAGGGGNDVLDGGGGVNTVSYAWAQSGVTVGLAVHGPQATGVGTDTLSHFQNLTGSASADTLTGDAGANVIVGGGGNDTIKGGGGADTLTGGAGADIFVVDLGQTGASVIRDFSAAQGDKLDLRAFALLHGLAGLAGHIAQSGADAVITLDTGTVTLSGVTASSLTGAQILFAPAPSTPLKAPADFNHDGLSDVLLRDSTTGDFGYMAPGPFGGSTWHAVGSSNPSYGLFAVADFNGDGASDMLLRNDISGDVGYVDMTPGGGPVWHDIGGSAVSYTVQGTGDFNGDHVTDMLWRNDNSGDVGYTALTSSGGASWVHLGNSSTAYTVEGTGDFNGDGVSDLLFRNDSTGDVGYTALTPSGGARWVYLGGSATAYAVQGSGDFNGDGVSDLLFRNQVTGDYGYTALTPSGGASWHALGVSDPTYTIVATGDFNGDGMADVLQRNTTTGDYGYMATSGSAGVWHDVGVTDASHFVL